MARVGFAALRSLLLAGALLTLAPGAFAQLPDTIASANLTRAQADELNRRLVTLQHRITGLAQETNLQAAAIRNIAVEIFGAQPNLDFQSYAQLLESGAHELRDYIIAARSRTTGTPELVALRQQAISAAENGRLSDARSLYNTLISSTRAARERQRGAENRLRDHEDLSDAADIAEAARIASAAADDLDAARLYAEAAALAPANERARWVYTVARADALVRHSERVGDTQIVQAINILENEALPLTEHRSLDWAATQSDLGGALALLGYRGDAGAARRAIAAHRQALEVYSRRDHPALWAREQASLASAFGALGAHGQEQDLRNAVIAYYDALSVLTPRSGPWASAQHGLADALLRLAERGDRTLVEPAIEAYRASLSATVRAEDPDRWSATQHNLAMALFLRGDDQSLRESVTAMRLSMEVYTRASQPAQWASSQLGLCNSLRGIGGDVELRQSLEACQDALSIITRDGDPAAWASAQYNLALTHGAYILRGDRSHLQPALRAIRDALAGYEQVGNPYWANKAREVIAQLERMQ